MNKTKQKAKRLSGQEREALRMMKLFKLDDAIINDFRRNRHIAAFSQDERWAWEGAIPGVNEQNVSACVRDEMQQIRETTGALIYAVIIHDGRPIYLVVPHAKDEWESRDKRQRRTRAKRYTTAYRIEHGKIMENVATVYLYPDTDGNITLRLSNRDVCSISYIEWEKIE